MMPTSCATRSSSLRVAQTDSRHPPRSHSPHSLSPHTCSPYSHAIQELQDDLLDDTASPVVMQLFNAMSLNYTIWEALEVIKVTVFTRV